MTHENPIHPIVKPVSSYGAQLFPIIPSQFEIEKLKNYLFFQQSGHIPSHNSWGQYATRFEQCPKYARSTISEWQSYQKLVEIFKEKHNIAREIDCFIIDADFSCLEKLKIFQEFVGPFQVIQHIAVPKLGFNHKQDRMTFVGFPKSNNTNQWDYGKRLGFLGCFPSVFRLLPLIYGNLEFDSFLTSYQHQNHAIKYEINNIVQRIRSRTDHTLFNITATLIENAPIEIFFHRDEISQYCMSEFRSACESMVYQRINRATDYDDLCLHHERIHHSIFMLCIFSRPYGYNDFINISRSLNKKYYPQLDNFSVSNYLFPNTMSAIFAPMLNIYETQGLTVNTVSLCPSSSCYDKCKSVYFELERPLSIFDTDGPANVIVTGFTTESILQDCCGKQLSLAIERGLNHYENLTVIFDIPFHVQELFDITWECVKAHVHSGRINFMIAENWHKYKGLGIEKCLSARLIIINNNNNAFKKLQNFIEDNQSHCFDYHPEFQYVLSIINTGFEYEDKIIKLQIDNRDQIFNIDTVLEQKHNKARIFSKSSIMLETKLDKNFVFKMSIKENFTFGFPFTSFNTFHDPGGKYISTRLPIGMEPLEILIEKLTPLFQTYYLNNLSSLSAEQSINDIAKFAATTNNDSVKVKDTFQTGLRTNTHIKCNATVSKTSLIRLVQSDNLQNNIRLIKDIFKSYGLTAVMQSTQLCLTRIHMARATCKECHYITASGKGVTQQSAIFNALLNLIESFLNNRYWNFRYKPSTSKSHSFTYFSDEQWFDFKKDNWIDGPLKKELKTLYTRIGFIDEHALNDINRCDDLKSICSFPFKRISNQRTQFIPKNILTELYNGSGSSAGSTEDIAQINGLFKLLERHVKKIIVANGYQLPFIPHHYLYGDAFISESIQSFEYDDFNINIKNASLGGKYPVVCASIVNRSTGLTHETFGAGPDLLSSTKRALLNLGQFLYGRKSNLYTKERRPFLSTFSLYNDLNHFFHHTHSYNHFRTTYHFADFSLDFKEIHGNEKEVLFQLYEIFLKEDYEVLVSKYHHHGFHSCEIIVPGVSENHNFNPKAQRFYHSLFRPYIEDILHISYLNKAHARRLSHHLESLDINYELPMNKLLGLFSSGNGFWDEAMLSNILFLLKQSGLPIEFYPKTSQSYASHPNDISNQIYPKDAFHFFGHANLMKFGCKVIS